MNRDNENECLKPSELVRTEAAALESLAIRLDGAMAADFDRAVDLIVHCGEANGRVVVTGMVFLAGPRSYRCRPAFRNHWFLSFHPLLQQVRAHCR